MMGQSNNIRFFLFVSLLLATSCATSGQQTTVSPTPIELKLEKLGKITAVSKSLKGISSSDPKFEAQEDFFRIQLPQPLAPYVPAKWPKLAGEMPTPSRTFWEMDEAEFAISITPLPPGLIQSWSADELLMNLTQTIQSGVQNASARKVYEQDVSVGAIKGREAKVIASGKVLFTRAFFANDRQYVLIAQLNGASKVEDLVKATLDTFEIMTPPKGLA